MSETMTLAPLGELGLWRGGGTPSKSNPSYWSGSIPWVSPKDMKTEVISDAEDHISETAVSESATQLIPAGSVLMVTRSGILAHSLPVAITSRDVTINQDLKAVTPHPGVEPRYLLKALQALELTILAECSKMGTTVASIEFDRLKEFPIPLVCEAEQRRIVAKLDALQSRTRLAREALASIPALLDHYRQSVLAAAVTGDLSAEYRQDRKPAAGWQGQIDQYTAGRKRGRTNSKDAAPANEIEQDLPPGWVLTAFDAICDEITVGHVGPMTHAYVDTGVPFLRSQNVRPLRFDRAGLIFVSKSFHVEHPKSRLRPGDLVVVRSGNAGQATVVPDEIPEANCADLVIARPSPLLNPWFAAIVINSPIWQRHVQGEQVGIAQAHFNVGSMRTTPIGLPPRDEQDFIAAKVMRLLGEIASISQTTGSMVNGVNHLDQSLLATAFRGELVPQDPADEPASVLLDRIRAARAQAGDAPRARRPRTPAAAPPPAHAAETVTPYRATTADPYATLLSALRSRGSLASADAQAATGLDAAAVRPLLQRLVSEGAAKVTGQKRGTRYVAI